MNYCAVFLIGESLNVDEGGNWENQLTVTIGQMILEGSARFLEIKDVTGISISLDANNELPGKEYTLIHVYLDVPQPKTSINEDMTRNHIGQRLKSGKGFINCIQPVNRDIKKTLITISIVPDSYN